MAIQLLPATEKKLSEIARSEGKGVEDLVVELLAERGPADDDDAPEYLLPAEEWVKRFNQWLDSFDGERRPLTNECLSREYIYFDTKF